MSGHAVLEKIRHEAIEGKMELWLFDYSYPKLIKIRWTVRWIMICIPLVLIVMVIAIIAAIHGKS